MFFRLTKIFATSTIVALTAMALAACGGSEPQDVSFDLTVVDRALTAENTTFSATQGDTVTLNLASDEDAEFHLHGYELVQEVAAGATGAITFEANATGRFPLEIHVVDTAEPSCLVDSTVSLHLMVEPGAEAGHFVVTAEPENFELHDGNHWHLFLDGELHGMFFDPSTEIQLTEGMHEVRGELVDADHCELGVRDTVMFTAEAHDTDAESHDDHDADAAAHDDHDADEQTPAEATAAYIAMDEADGAMDHDAEADDHEADDHEADEHGADEHEHEGDEIDVAIGALEIRPR